jgi:hypothetical protein
MSVTSTSARVTKPNRPATFDHLKKKKPVEKTIQIVTEDQPLLDYEAAVEAYEKLKFNLSGSTAPADVKKLKELQKKVDEAKEKLDEVTLDIKFRAIGRKAYDDLLAEYPNPKEEEDRTEQDPAWHPETFPIALVAASMVPGEGEAPFTYEQIEELWNDWNTGEIMELFYTALAVNSSRRVIESGKGYGSTRN